MVLVLVVAAVAVAVAVVMLNVWVVATNGEFGRLRKQEVMVYLSYYRSISLERQSKATINLSKELNTGPLEQEAGLLTTTRTTSRAFCSLQCTVRTRKHLTTNHKFISS